MLGPTIPYGERMMKEKTDMTVSPGHRGKRESGEQQPRATGCHGREFWCEIHDFPLLWLRRVGPNS